MTNMRKKIAFSALFCAAVLLFSGVVAAETKMLWSYSGKSLNDTTVRPVMLGPGGMGEMVKFTAPSQNWKIKEVHIPGTDGWNETENTLPPSETISLEIRDKDLNLIHHWSDVQIDYFTFPTGFGVAVIEVPSITVNGDFYVIFYDRGAVLTLAELENVNGNSFIYNRVTKEYVNAQLIRDNQTIPVNWLIGVVGE
ncbi:MAG: hypothetical protein QFX31_08200 [Methanothrix sp.]|uniref:hypothetical protein n=1 Tax=Methanothrix sp. TaxID=90426 RepID=UPI0032AFECEC|nr:hypothetical protein [Methanothrix sp.]